jgi:hypothetical protein
LAKRLTERFGSAKEFEEYFTEYLRNMKSIPTLQERADAEVKRQESLPEKFWQQ